MYFTKQEKREMIQQDLRALIKHPIRMSGIMGRKIKFLWKITGIYPADSIKQTACVRFFVWLRRLVGRLPAPLAENQRTVLYEGSDRERC